MTYIPQEAVAVFDAGYGTDEIVRRRITNAEGKPASSRTARRWRQEWKSRKENQAEVIGLDDSCQVIYDLIKDHPTSLYELSEKLDRSESSVLALITEMMESGYNILRDDRTVQAPTNVSVKRKEALEPIADSMEMKIAVPSDLHKGSKHEQITSFRRFISYARERGVKHFAVPGDVTSGQHGYKGQALDQYAWSADDQLECLNRDIVPLPDERWYVLGGNHDYWHIQYGGTDVVWRFCQQWENVFYLGYDAADIPLTDRLRVRLWHPSGGTPYAASYRLQKGMENAAYEELLQWTSDIEDPSTIALFLAGHLHLENSLHRGPMLAALCGCFEGRTNYLARKGLYPEIGAYIFTLGLNDAGFVQREVREWVRFREYAEDYKKYEELPQPEPDRVEIMFRLPD